MAGSTQLVRESSPAAPHAATGAEWSEERWREVFSAAQTQALDASSDAEAWPILVRYARSVLRTYSGSFFVVTRFLPQEKRDRVEVIYSAVRYPDEVVDTFPWPKAACCRELDRWAEAYEAALDGPGLRDALAGGAPPFVAAFAQVVRTCGIPPEHYRSFLDAMRRDAHPRPFETMDDLVESYVYGSAIVVGYFLTYVYGSTTPGDFPRALTAARDLGIALQLTNFIRDVADDQRRGRLYLPLDLLRAEGITRPDAKDPGQHDALGRVVRRVAGIAGEYYGKSMANLDAFAADSRTAIDACVRVYGNLNERIRRSPDGILHRESVPFVEKFRLLPFSKYWRLPIAYLRD